MIINIAVIIPTLNSSSYCFYFHKFVLLPIISKIQLLTKMFLMKKTYVLVLLFICKTLHGQDVIDVSEQSIIVKGMKTEEIFFAFAKGDQVIISIEEADKKEIRDFQFIEYPSTVKYSEVKFNNIQDKNLKIANTGVYKISLYNSALTNRTCKIRIKRIPQDASTANFNTTVKWATQYDTTWKEYSKNIIVGYDTIHTQKYQKVLISTKQSDEVWVDRTERVHSKTNLNSSNKTYFQVNLPNGVSQTNYSKQVIGWAYWISVGQEGQEAYKKNVADFTKLASSATSVFVSPLAGLVVGTVGNLYIPTTGEDVAYHFMVDITNAQLFYSGNNFYQFNQGKGTAAYGKVTDRNKGSFYIGLYNDNYMQGIDVNIKIVLVWEEKIYEDQSYIDTSIKPKHELKWFKDPIVTSALVPTVDN